MTRWIALWAAPIRILFLSATMVLSAPLRAVAFGDNVNPIDLLEMSSNSCVDCGQICPNDGVPRDRYCRPLIYRAWTPPPSQTVASVEHSVSGSDADARPREETTTGDGGGRRPRRAADARSGAGAEPQRFRPYRTPVRGGYDPNAPIETQRNWVHGRFRHTIIEAPPNPYTRPESARALIETALARASARSRHQCWTHVRQAIARAGLIAPDSSGRLPSLASNSSGEDRVRKLENAGWRNILTNDLRRNPEKAPVGSVVIYAVPGRSGDAQIRTQRGFVSDFYWPAAYTNQTYGSRVGRVVGVMVFPNM